MWRIVLLCACVTVLAMVLVCMDPGPGTHMIYLENYLQVKKCMYFLIYKLFIRGDKQHVIDPWELNFYMGMNMRRTVFLHILTASFWLYIYSVCVCVQELDIWFHMRFKLSKADVFLRILQTIIYAIIIITHFFLYLFIWVCYIALKFINISYPKL